MSEYIPCIKCHKRESRKGGKYCQLCHNASMRKLRKRKKEELKNDLCFLVEVADKRIDGLLKAGKKKSAKQLNSIVEGIARRQRVPRNYTLKLG